MIERFVTPMDPEAVVIGPANPSAAVMQNVRMILTTPKGSVPLDRDFGLSFMVVDQPEPRAQAMLISEIITQVARYEPRARVTQVDFIAADHTETADGRLFPRVRLRIEV